MQPGIKALVVFCVFVLCWTGLTVAFARFDEWKFRGTAVCPGGRGDEMVASKIHITLCDKTFYRESGRFPDVYTEDESVLHTLVAVPALLDAYASVTTVSWVLVCAAAGLSFRKFECRNPKTQYVYFLSPEIPLFFVCVLVAFMYTVAALCVHEDAYVPPSFSFAHLEAITFSNRTLRFADYHVSDVRRNPAQHDVVFWFRVCAATYTMATVWVCLS